MATKRERDWRIFDSKTKGKKLKDGCDYSLSLPKEILGHVIGYLDQVHDRYRIMLTCKRWNNVGEKYYFDPNVRYQYPILYASRTDKWDVVRKILDHEKTKEIPNRIFYDAIELPDGLDILTTLVNHEKSKLDTNHELGSKILFKATRKGSARMVKFLVESGKIKDPFLHTSYFYHREGRGECDPLFWACASNDVDVVRELMEFPESRSREMMALEASIEDCCWEVVLQLFRYDRIFSRFFSSSNKENNHHKELLSKRFQHEEIQRYVQDFDRDIVSQTIEKLSSEGFSFVAWEYGK